MNTGLFVLIVLEADMKAGKGETNAHHVKGRDVIVASMSGGIEFQLLKNLIQMWVLLNIVKSIIEVAVIRRPNKHKIDLIILANSATAAGLGGVRWALNPHLNSTSNISSTYFERCGGC